MPDIDKKEITDEAVRLAAIKFIASPEAYTKFSAAMRSRVTDLLRNSADKIDPAITDGSGDDSVTDTPNGDKTVESYENREAVAEDFLTSFKSQYESLPKDNILDGGSTWEKVETRLTSDKYADKMKRVTEELQGGGRLYAVMEDGTCEFMDDNSAEPPMFVENKETGQLQIIFNRDEEEMEEARNQINAGTHEWVSIQKMLDWAENNKFDVFEADMKESRRFGKLMELAEASSPDGLFVGKKGGDWMATALMISKIFRKDALYANFDPYDGRIYVGGPDPEARDGDLGLLRRINI